MTPTTEDYVVVLTTLPAEGDDARRIGRTLVAERLAACVNVMGPMVSLYRWNDEIQEEEERQLVIKTARRRVPALWDRLKELHPYDVPEFVVLTIVDGNDAYLKWIAESTSGPE